MQKLHKRPIREGEEIGFSVAHFDGGRSGRRRWAGLHALDRPDFRIDVPAADSPPAEKTERTREAVERTEKRPVALIPADSKPCVGNQDGDVDTTLVRLIKLDRVIKTVCSLVICKYIAGVFEQSPGAGSGHAIDAPDDSVDIHLARGFE